ncbi:MAG: hypothetical protein U0Y68_18365 [Blastocatellia bacterium]
MNLNFATIHERINQNTALTIPKLHAAIYCAIFLQGASLSKVSAFTGLRTSELMPIFDELNAKTLLETGSLSESFLRQSLNDDEFVAQLTQKPLSALAPVTSTPTTKIGLVREAILDLCKTSKTPFGREEARLWLIKQGQDAEITDSDIANAFYTMAKKNVISVVNRPAQGHPALYQATGKPTTPARTPAKPKNPSLPSAPTVATPQPAPTINLQQVTREHLLQVRERLEADLRALNRTIELL